MTVKRPMKVLLACGAAVALALAVTARNLPAQWGAYGPGGYYGGSGFSVQWPGGGLSIGGGGLPAYGGYYPGYYYGGYPTYGYRSYYYGYYPSYRSYYYAPYRVRRFHVDDDFFD